MAETFEAPGLHDDHHEEHGHEPTAKLDPKSAKKLAKGHKEEIVLAVIGIIVAIYFYMRSSSSSASPAPATSSSPAPTGSGTGSGGGSSGPGPSTQGYGSQNNTLLQEILGYLQSLPTTTTTHPGGTTPVPTPTTPTPPKTTTTTQTYPSGGPTNPSGYTSYGTKSPYTPAQIAQNSPGPQELSVQAQNNAAWAKAYASNPAGNPLPKTVTYPVSKTTPPKTMSPSPVSGGSSYHQATPVSVYHGGGSGSGTPVKTVTKAAAKPITTSRVAVGHNYLRG